LIYINDIDESVGCKILKFADDTKIYNKIKSDEDIANLQSICVTLLRGLRNGRCFSMLKMQSHAYWV